MQDCSEKLEGLREEEISLPFSSDKVGDPTRINQFANNVEESNQNTRSDTSDILIHHEYKVTDVIPGIIQAIK